MFSSYKTSYYELKPGETETLEIVFRPSKHDTPVLSTIIFMDLDLVNPNDTPEEFGKVSVRGVGGEFGLSSGSFDAETGNPKVDLPFNRVNKGTRIKKTFELVNTGDTIIHLEVLDSNREICGPIPREMIAGTVGFKVEPSEAIIQARGSQKFNFVLRVS